ncbi:MAG: hypothetical protein AB1586_00875 [Pseudomonadota bacterium]
MTTEAGQSRPSNIGVKSIVAAIAFVGLVVGLAVASNKLLDRAGIATGPGLTIEQRKEKALRNQREWDRSASDTPARKTAAMCTDDEVVEVAKRLINEQTPNATKLGRTLQELEAARGGGVADVIKAREKTLQETRDMYARNPLDPNNKYDSDQLAERVKNITGQEAEISRLKAKLAEETQKKASSQIQIIENEIFVVDEPFSTEYEPNIDRVTCQVRYRVKGPGHGDDVHDAIYTVQPGRQDWIINLMTLS